MAGEGLIHQTVTGLQGGQGPCNHLLSWPFPSRGFPAPWEGFLGWDPHSLCWHRDREKELHFQRQGVGLMELAQASRGTSRPLSSWVSFPNWSRGSGPYRTSCILGAPQACADSMGANTEDWVQGSTGNLKAGLYRRGGTAGEGTGLSKGSGSVNANGSLKAHHAVLPAHSVLSPHRCFLDGNVSTLVRQWANLPTRQKHLGCLPLR